MAAIESLSLAPLAAGLREAEACKEGTELQLANTSQTPVHL